MQKKESLSLIFPPGALSKAQFKSQKTNGYEPVLVGWEDTNFILPYSDFSNVVLDLKKFI